MDFNKKNPSHFIAKIQWSVVIGYGADSAEASLVMTLVVGYQPSNSLVSPRTKFTGNKNIFRLEAVLRAKAFEHISYVCLVLVHCSCVCKVQTNSLHAMGVGEALDDNLPTILYPHASAASRTHEMTRGSFILYVPTEKHTHTQK